MNSCGSFKITAGVSCRSDITTPVNALSEFSDQIPRLHSDVNFFPLHTVIIVNSQFVKRCCEALKLSARIEPMPIHEHYTIILIDYSLTPYNTTVFDAILLPTLISAHSVQDRNSMVQSGFE